MKKRSLLVFMAVAVLAGCSKTEVENSALGGGDEIALRSSVVKIDADTRTAYKGDNLAANPITALVLASETSNDYSTPLYCAGSMTFNGGDAVVYNKPVLSGTPKYPSSGSKYVYLSGFYPATGWDYTTTANKASFALTGCQDVMYAGQQQTNLMETQDDPATYAVLKFEHQLTLMNIAVYGDNDAVNTEGIVVTNVRLAKAGGDPVRDCVDINLASKAVTYSGAGASLACFVPDSDTAFATDHAVTVGASASNAVGIAYVIPPAVTASAVAGQTEYTFTIDYKDKNNKAMSMDVDVDLKADAGGTTSFGVDTKGYAFNIIFKFIGNQIKATASVTDWEPGGTTEMEI